MPGRATEGIVLRRHPFGETSQIARVFTRDQGLVAILAKGSRRPKSRFGGGLDLLQRGTMVLGHRASRALDLLHEWKVAEWFPDLREEYTKIVIALHATEVLLRGLPERQAEPELWSIFLGFLRALEQAPPDAAPLVGLAGLARTLRAMGFAPALHACVACGDTRDLSGRLSLSPGRGGLLCRRCGPTDPRRLPVRPGVASVLRQALRLGPDGLARVRIPPSLRGEALQTLEAFAGYHLDRPLRSLESLPLDELPRTRRSTGRVVRARSAPAGGTPGPEALCRDEDRRGRTRRGTTRKPAGG